MALQPDHILYPRFENVNSYGSNDEMEYFYRSGSIHVNNGVNIDEYKILLDSESTATKRATRIKSRTDRLSSPYITPEGTEITFNPEDEIWVNHNYTGNFNVNRSISSIEDSWWYDVTKHREYKVWFVVGYGSSKIIDGVKYYNWRVQKAFIEYNAAPLDETQGTFRFTSIPETPVGITGSVSIEATGATWGTIKAKLYKGTDSNLPGTVISTTSYSTGGSTNTTLEVKDNLRPVDINQNDRITLAVEVEGSSASTPLKVTDYILEVNGAEGEYTERKEVFLIIDQDSDIDPNCSPLINNVNDQRGNDQLQVVEFEINDISEGILKPSNLPEIIKRNAKIADVPASNYTQAGFIQGRYNGSKLTRTEVNSIEFPQKGHLNGTGLTFTTTNLSEEGIEQRSNIAEIKDTNLGYFNQIIDPYPVLNGKTTYFVKYLINSNKTVQDPSISDLGKINFNNTFKEKDINQKPGLYKPSIPNDTNHPELLDLRVPSTIFKKNEYPYPILWSQISATEYTKKLPLTGSQDFFTSEIIDVNSYTNLAFNTSGEVTNKLPIQSSPSAALTSISSTLVGPPIDSSGYIGSQNQEIYHPPAIDIPRDVPITDSYNIKGKFTFFSTSLPRQEDRTWLGLFNSLKSVNLGNSFFSILKNGNNITIKDIILNIYHETVDSSGTYSVGGKYEKIQLGFPTPSTKSTGGIFYKNKSNQYVIHHHSDINDLMNINSQQKLSPQDGYRIRYEIDFTIPTNFIDKGTKFEFKFEVPSWNPINIKRERDDWWLNKEGVVWKRSLMPNIPEGNPNNAFFSLSMLGSNTSQTTGINEVNAPYWSQTGVNQNQIKLISPHLNERYASNFFQGKLDYIPSTNPIFPASQEPSYTGFPGAIDQFEILPGDEFRFQNNESETYKVKSVTIVDNQLIVTLNKNISSHLNLDFFLIRRYKPLEGIIILNQQKPYTFPPSSSSSPGLLLPEYLNEDLETNPDAVITDLIGKNLI